MRNSVAFRRRVAIAMKKRFQFIREKRKKQNLTIEQLAEKADVSIDLVARLERGERDDISVSKLEKILAVLGMELGDVFKTSKLQENGNKFRTQFLKLKPELREKYAKIFLDIMELKNK